MDAAFLQSKFNQALAYPQYLATGTDEQQRRWAQVYDAARLTSEQQLLVSGYTRQMHILIVSGIWCGDCVQQCPLIQRITEANPAKVLVRLVDRDQHKDLMTHCRLNAGDRVPVVIFMAEDCEFCALGGDRTIHRYRALIRNKLGASCPTGIGPPDSNEMASTLADWSNEIERVQWMLRLSPRLRQKYGD